MQRAETAKLSIFASEIKFSLLCSDSLSIRQETSPACFSCRTFVVHDVEGPP